jgi:hypothetical protein
MHSIYQLKMPYCSAFDRFNNPCLNEISNNDDVCISHNTFYTPSIWFDRYVFGPRSYSFSAPSKTQAVYLSAILNKRIPITQLHFKQLETSGKSHSELLDYYLLCCRQKGVDPLWSNTFFNLTVNSIIKLHTPALYDLIQLNRRLLDQFLDPLFNSSRSFESIMFYILFRIILHSKSLHAEASIHIDNPHVSLLQYIQSHTAFKREFLWMYSNYEDTLLKLLSCADTGKHTSPIYQKIKTFIETFPSMRKIEREIKAREFHYTKLELMDIAWHPSRFLDWCLTTEELKGLKERWSSLSTS